MRDARSFSHLFRPAHCAKEHGSRKGGGGRNGPSGNESERKDWRGLVPPCEDRFDEDTEMWRETTGICSATSACMVMRWKLDGLVWTRNRIRQSKWIDVN